jgi:thiol-disulfide isomerase/thioredoxin
MKYVFLVAIFLVIGCEKEPIMDASNNQIPDITHLDDIMIPVKEGVWCLFFYNVWSKNCLEMRGRIEALSENPAFDVVHFGEIAYDSHLTLARYFAVNGFPTVLIFKNGLERRRYLGSEHSLAILEKALMDML